MSDSVRAGLEDPDRIEAARRLQAQARREVLDRLAALSARLLGAAHAQIALVAETPIVIAPTGPRSPPVAALTAEAFAPRAPLVLAHASRAGVSSFLGVPINVVGARVGVLCVY